MLDVRHILLSSQIFGLFFGCIIGTSAHVHLGAPFPFGTINFGPSPFPLLGKKNLDVDDL